MSAPAQDQRVIGNKYLNRMFYLILAIALSIPVAIVGGVIFYLSLHSNQELIRDCVAKDRANSACQRYSDQRTGRAVGTLGQITEAYVLCADRLNGDNAIKKCVAERLQNDSR